MDIDLVTLSKPVELLTNMSGRCVRLDTVKSKMTRRTTTKLFDFINIYSSPAQLNEELPAEDL